jgi:hypothetical protein
MGNHHSHSHSSEDGGHGNGNKFNIVTSNNGINHHGNQTESKEKEKEKEIIEKSICICSKKLNPENCENVKKNESPGYELVKIGNHGNGSMKKRNSSRRVSYNWRKIQESQNGQSAWSSSAAQIEIRCHDNPKCPLFVPIVDSQGAGASGAGGSLESLNSLEKLCKFLISVSKDGPNQINKNSVLVSSKFQSVFNFGGKFTKFSHKIGRFL